METTEAQLWVLVYTSAATRDIPREELGEMLAGGRRRNRARGVTGLLVYHDGMFMQALEGPQPVVHALMAAISADDRHRGIFILLDEAASERRFAEHAMAYRDTGRGPFPEGFSGLLNPGAPTPFADSRDRVHRLLRSFAETVLRRRPVE